MINEDTYNTEVSQPNFGTSALNYQYSNINLFQFRTACVVGGGGILRRKLEVFYYTQSEEIRKIPCEAYTGASEPVSLVRPWPDHALLALESPTIKKML